MKHSKNSANGGNVQHTLEDGVDMAAKAAHNTIDSFSEAARPALDQIVSNAHVAVNRASVTANHAAGAIGDTGDKLNDNGRKIIARAESYVHDYPVASLGVAVATGYLLSRLFSSR